MQTIDHVTNPGTNTETTPDWTTWPDPWDGVSAKLEHAWRHFEILKAHAIHYLSQNFVRTEVAAAPERGPNWLKCELHVKHPGTLLSLILGDFLNNLRCALDHSLTAINPQAGRNLNFPVAITSGDWEAWAEKWRKAGGQEGALAAIGADQPYRAGVGQDPKDHRLRILSRLNNADKHRLLQVMHVGLSDEIPPNLKIKATTRVRRYEYLLRHGCVLTEQQTALFVELDMPVTKAGFEISGSIPTGIAIDDYFNIIELGQGLHRGIVKTCRRLRDGSLDNWGHAGQ